MDQAANVQRRLRELSEQQCASEEQIGGLTNVAEGYVRLCLSIRVCIMYSAIVSSVVDKVDASWFLMLESKLTTAGKWQRPI